VAQSIIGIDSSSCNVNTQQTGCAWIKTYNNNGEAEWEYLNICGTSISSDPYSRYYGISSCHIKLGVYYLGEIFSETSQVTFKSYVTYIYTAMAADFTINIEFVFEKAGFFTFNPWRGFFTMGNTIKAQVFEYAMKLMLITKFQEVLLRFVSIAAFPAMFVAGAVLRTFTFTRKLGGLLMAIALVLYFIFPMFYAFGALVVLEIKHKNEKFWCSDKDLNPAGCVPTSLAGIKVKGYNPNPPIADMMYVNGIIPMPLAQNNKVDLKEAVKEYDELEGITPEKLSELAQSGKYKNKQYFPDFNMFGDTSTITPAEKEKVMSDSKKKMDSFVSEMASRRKFDWSVSDSFKPGGQLDILARLAFFSLFFSLFGILASIAAIRSLSITLGGDVEIAGLTHLI